MAREIFTSKGEVILVDDQEFDYLNQFAWRIGAGGYAVRWGRVAPGKKGRFVVLMHREILGLDRSDKRVCDHKNHVKTDNRRANIRVCTPRQNVFNIPAYGSSGLKGVCWDKQFGKWRARIWSSGKRRLLGLFDTAEEASEVYNLASAMVHGEFAVQCQ